MIVGTLLLIGASSCSPARSSRSARSYHRQGSRPFFAPLMIVIFIPFYIVSLIVSDPHALIVRIFTYFPYSAPVTAMLRNSFGSLSPTESAVVIAELFILGSSLCAWPCVCSATGPSHTPRSSRCEMP